MPLDTIVESCRVMIVRSADLTRFGPGELDLLGAALLGDVEDDEAAGLQLVVDRLLGVRVDLPLALDTDEVDGLEDVRAAHDRYAACSAMPSRRRSSSGVVERLSASFALIWPERTSCASAVSIVCMPMFAPVCSDE